MAVTQKENVYKKFMFNRRFDVDEEPEIKLDDNELSELLKGSQGDSLALEKMIEADSDKKVIDDTPVVIAPSFSQEQLDEAVKKARDEGLKAGRDEANASIAKKQDELLEKVTQLMGDIAKRISEQNEGLLKDSLEVAKVMLKKVFPEVSKNDGFMEVMKFLEDAFRSLVREPSLSVQVNPDNIPFVKEKLTDLAKKGGFSGKIVIEGKENLGRADCKIVWDNGGVERDSEKIALQAEKVLSSYIGIKG